MSDLYPIYTDVFVGGLANGTFKPMREKRPFVHMGAPAKLPSIRQDEDARPTRSSEPTSTYELDSIAVAQEGRRIFFYRCTEISSAEAIEQILRTFGQTRK